MRTKRPFAAATPMVALTIAALSKTVELGLKCVHRPELIDVNLRIPGHASFIDKRGIPCSLIPRTLTEIVSPSETISLGCSKREFESCETWTRPSKIIPS